MFTESELKTINKALKIVNSKRLQTSFCDSTFAAKTEAVLKIGSCEREVFAIFCLNAQYQIINFVEVFQGTVNAAQVYVREVVKTALQQNACAVVVVHNHPSGNLDPSDSDKRLTERLIKALRLVDIQVLDHIIVAHGASFSFAENCLI